MQEKRALGKGLSSLIPLVSRPEAAVKNYFECPLEDIIPSPGQPRKLFDKTAIEELAASIKEKGLLQPVVVRRLGGGKYEIIAGERRFRAAKLLRLEKIPVVVKEVEDQETMEMALIENIQREALNPVEEAMAYKDLIQKYQYTQDELAERLGKDRSSIANTLRLLKLPDTVRSLILSNQITMGHARALLGIEDDDLQIKMAEQIVKDHLSVRDIEGLIRKLKDENLEDKNEISEVKKNPTEKSAYYQLEEQLRQYLKTKVVIRSSGKEKGKIVIPFHSQEELDVFFQKLAH